MQDAVPTETAHGSVCLANEVHYASCKIPTLRFLLAHGTAGCPLALFEYPYSPMIRTSCGAPLQLTDATRGIVFSAWETPPKLSAWQEGRRERHLSEDEAQRVRDAFREGALDARLESGERIL